MENYKKRFPLFFSGLIVIPFLMISMYIHPSSDDYSYHVQSLTSGYLQSQKEIYLTWSGRYTASSILTLPFVLKYGLFFYRLFPVVLLLSLMAGAYFLIKEIYIDTIVKSRRWLFCAFIFVFFYLQPSISQGIYWFSGSVTYQLANVLSLFLIGFYIRFVKREVNNMYWFGLLVLSAIIIGLNETSMLLLDTFLFIALVMSFYKKMGYRYKLLSVFLLAIVLSMVVVKCPGNAIRANPCPNKENMVYATLKSIHLTKQCLGVVLPILIPIFILLVTNGIKLRDRFFVNPWLAVLITLVLTSFGFFIGCWAVGAPPPLRTINVIYFVFVVGAFYSIFCFESFYRRQGNVFLDVSKNVKILLCVLLFFYVARENNITRAYLDLGSGTAFAYDKELMVRCHKIQKSDLKNIMVKPLKNQPKTLFFKDITVNPNHWRNEAYVDYFNLTNSNIKTIALELQN